LRCLASVQAWCERQGFGYQLIGDELFQLVPEQLRQKLWHRKPVLADLARLTLMGRHLGGSSDIVLWLDADCFVVDTAWTPDLSASASFGEEFWIDRDKAGRLTHFRQPHNAFMVFHTGNPVLPFLEYLSSSLLERVHAEAVAPQMIGPKLLKTLHNLAMFSLHPKAGALSPLLAEAVVAGEGEALDYFLLKAIPVPRVWNLCGSLSQTNRHEHNLEKITSCPELLGRLRR
jgi:hypothetical protein